MAFTLLPEKIRADSDPVTHWLMSKAKVDLLEEVILDLEYDSFLGRLTKTEKESIEVSCHVPKCTPEMAAMFWSRFEEKLDEKLAVCGITDENTEPAFHNSDLDAQSKHNRQLWQQVCRQIAELTQVLQDTCALQKDVMGRRDAYQKSLLLALGKTLGKEVQNLSSRADCLEAQIHQLLLQPSKRAVDLQTAYNDLLREKEEVEQRISELDALLQAYLANEKKFLELANSKADAERQMLVLQGIKDAGSSCRREPTGRRRRSFSTNTLELDEHGGRKFVATDF
ncbi:hypothetical protein SprV_0401613800 [Sparganum proliferum]